MELLPAGSKPFIGGSTTGSAARPHLRLRRPRPDLRRRRAGRRRLRGRRRWRRLQRRRRPAPPLQRPSCSARSLAHPARARLPGGRPVPASLGRTAPTAALAGYLLWGSWFVVTAIVFSYMSGVIHSYYAVALAPAIAALVGAGLVDLWGTPAADLARRRSPSASSAWARPGSARRCSTGRPTSTRGSGSVGDRPAAVALLVLVAASLPALADNAAVQADRARRGRRSASCATLLAPAAYALDTTGTAYGGGDPHPGPGTARRLRRLRRVRRLRRRRLRRAARRRRSAR